MEFADVAHSRQMGSSRHSALKASHAIDAEGGGVSKDEAE